MNVYISMLTTQTLKNWVLGQRYEYAADPAKVGKEINTRLGGNKYTESTSSGRLAESNPMVCNEQAWWEPKMPSNVFGDSEKSVISEQLVSSAWE